MHSILLGLQIAAVFSSFIIIVAIGLEKPSKTQLFLLLASIASFIDGLGIALNLRRKQKRMQYLQLK